MDIEFLKDLIRIFLEKGILALALLLASYIITKSIEKIKSNEAFKNEITKKRVERIAIFYDFFSEFEHWSNRIFLHYYYWKKGLDEYLTNEEFEEAKDKSEALSKIIGFELNKMRFWINDDIYNHTVYQLELFNELTKDIINNSNFEKIKEYRLKLDTIRMNIDKLIQYLKTNPDIKIVKYDRSLQYK